VAGNWRNWISHRFALRPIREKVLDRRVAKSPWYYGDGATLFFLFSVLVGTGMLMTLTYTPSPDAAYESVRYITEEQYLGWFIRGLHYWSAGMMVVMIFFHLFRILLVGGYKLPREGTYLIGVFLFFGVMIMAFTGYILRWDERALYGLQVVMHMFSRVPFIGDELVRFVIGGEEIGARTLTRLYAVHVIFVPATLAGLIGFHLYLVIVHSITSKREREQPVHTVEEQKALYEAQAESEEEGEVFYPETAAHSGLFALVVFGIVLGLTLAFGPQFLYPEANRVTTSLPEEEWWFWWYSALIALLPSRVAPWFVVAFPIVLFLAMILLPFVDRRPERGIRKRPFMAVFVCVCVIGLLVLTEMRYRSPWTGWPSDMLPNVPAGMQMTERTEAGRQLFATFGCNSCHAVDGDGPRIGPDIARVSDRLSRAEMRAFVLRPPDGVTMPAYEGRLSDEQLELLIEFMHVVQTVPLEER
jgi:ubiquinol-cytochrome c reductase cytochrome b subunit